MSESHGLGGWGRSCDRMDKTIRRCGRGFAIYEGGLNGDPQLFQMACYIWVWDEQVHNMSWHRKVRLWDQQLSKMATHRNLISFEWNLISHSVNDLIVYFKSDRWFSCTSIQEFSTRLFLISVVRSGIF